MSDVQIHPTAIIDPGAELGARTSVGPYCVIGPDVVLGPDCWLQHHVTLCGAMKAGAKNKFYAYCSIGQQTQDLKYRGEPTYLACLAYASPATYWCRRADSNRRPRAYETRALTN